MGGAGRGQTERRPGSRPTSTICGDIQIRSRTFLAAHQAQFQWPRRLVGDPTLKIIEQRVGRSLRSVCTVLPPSAAVVAPDRTEILCERLFERLQLER